ncbi:MAG TPA: hypothetical protein VIG30_10565 [Ktedonobacterales bacterium]|jgi:hypothetical protein
MDEFWRNEDAGRVPPSGDGYGERVVPAEGDPAVADYRARHGARDLPRYRLFWMRAPVARRRRGVRWWLGAALVVALGLLLIKPLAVLAAVLLAVLLGVVVFGLLAAGTLLLAARVVLGGRAPWPLGRLGHLARHE